MIRTERNFMHPELILLEVPLLSHRIPQNGVEAMYLRLVRACGRVAGHVRAVHSSDAL